MMKFCMLPARLNGAVIGDKEAEDNDINTENKAPRSTDGLAFRG